MQFESYRSNPPTLNPTQNTEPAGSEKKKKKKDKKKDKKTLGVF